MTHHIVNAPADIEADLRKRTDEELALAVANLSIFIEEGATSKTHAILDAVVKEIRRRDLPTQLN